MPNKTKEKKPALSREEKAARRKKRGKIAGIVIAAMLAAVIVFICVCSAMNKVSVKSNENFIKTISAVEYESQLIPEIADDGYYTFITDDDFRIMQLTDVHIGAGCFSVKKDSMALNAVAAMVAEEKPDLVVVSGDIAFPVPFQAGTLDNKSSAKLFAELMEQLGVYWCPVFGNHDTESYSKYTREEISKFYESGDYPHCLLQAGPEDVDGYSNYIVNIKNTAGKITQSLVLIDSLSYVGERAIDGIIMKYDRIHDNQVEWYKNQITALTEENGGETPKSLAFFHIPLIEYKDAWTEYIENGNQDTENVKYYYGTLGEPGDLICCPEENCGLFDAALELGSTQGFFCGHDHLNNFSLDYKGIRLTYSYSIDYLAYFQIAKYGSQRGCTIITVSPDGSFYSVLENYYQDKYQAVHEKESVKMEGYIV